MVRMSPRPKLEDVARTAGVSSATVSRCLNTPALVREETRRRVAGAIRELGYTPHFGGRALAMNRTNTVGAVIPTMENAIFAHGLQALETALAEAGVTLLVATSQYEQAREEQQIRMLMGRGVDGLVLIGHRRPELVHRMLVADGIPFVIMWSVHWDSPYPAVGFDNHAAAAAMAAEVVARGHRRIAMLAGVTAGNDRAEDRVAGVRSALADAGLSLAPPMLVEAPYDIPRSAEAARDLLLLEDRPTAVLCGNDVQAAGVLLAARDLGLRVPEDLSVAGFDDIELARAVSPPLTTVRVPHRRMGRAAAEMLLDQIRGADTGRVHEIETSIVHRASLGPVPSR